MLRIFVLDRARFESSADGTMCVNLCNGFPEIFDAAVDARPHRHRRSAGPYKHRQNDRESDSFANDPLAATLRNRGFEDGWASTSDPMARGPANTAAKSDADSGKEISEASLF